jgi:hypothetical protein
MNCSPVIILMLPPESKKPMQHCRQACPPHRTLRMCLLQCTIQMPEFSWDKAQQQQQAYELFPSDNSHITARIEETNKALQVGMPHTQNIEFYRRLILAFLQCTTTDTCAMLSLARSRQPGQALAFVPLVSRCCAAGAGFCLVSVLVAFENLVSLDSAVGGFAFLCSGWLVLLHGFCHLCFASLCNTIPLLSSVLACVAGSALFPACAFLFPTCFSAACFPSLLCLFDKLNMRY